MRTRPRHTAAQLARLESRRLLAGVDIDRSFGVDGTVAVPATMGALGDDAVAIAALPNGGFLTAGTATRLHLAKYDAHGILDTRFGTAGYASVLQAPTAYSFSVKKLIALGSGDFLLAATHRLSASHSDWTFQRYHANGSPDLTFGTGGIVSIAGPGSAIDTLSDVKVLSDGTIVAVGGSRTNSVTRGLIARLNPDGSPDNDAPGGAVQFIDFTDGSLAPFDSEFTSLLVLPQGDYIAAGVADPRAPVAPVSNLRRYTQEGSLVDSFGAGGLAVTSAWVVSMILVPDGSVLAQDGFELTRFDPATGIFDAAYGTRAMVPDPGVPMYGLRIPTVLTEQGNLAVVYRGTSGLTAGLFSLDAQPITTSKGGPARATGGVASDIAILTGGQVVAITRLPTSYPENAPLGMIRFNLFDSGPILIDDGTDSYHLRLNDGDTNALVHVEGADLVAIVDGVEHRVALAAHRRLIIADAGGADTITIGACGDLDVQLDSDFGDDLIRLDGTRTARLHVRAYAGNDRFEVKLPPGGSARGFGTLTLDGEFHDDRIVVIGSEADDTILLDAPLSPGSVLDGTLANVESMTVRGGGGDDTIRVEHLPSHLALTVDGENGNDTLVGAIHDYAAFNDPEPTLLGGAGEDRLAVSPARMKYFLDGGADADSIGFIGSATDDTLTVLGESLTYTFANAAGTATVRSVAWEALSFEGNSGIDRLLLDNGSFTIGAAYRLSASTLRRDGLTLVTGSYEQLDLRAGSGDDSFVVIDFPVQVTLSGGSGLDSLLVDETAQTSGRTYAVGATVARDGIAINHSGIESATLLAGSGADTIHFSPQAQTNWLVVGGDPGASPGDELVIRIGGVSNTTVVEGSPGNGLVTFGNRLPVEYRSIENISTARPVAQSAVHERGINVVRFALEVPAQWPVGTPIAPTVQAVNLTTGQTIPANRMSAFVSGNTFNVRVSSSGAALPNGHYRITLLASTLKDLVGSFFDGSLSLDFHVLNGDANDDRVVDFADLLLVAQNYGRSVTAGSAGYGLGDISGDGRVDFTDILMLNQNYGNRLLPISVASVGNRRSLALSLWHDIDGVL